MRVVGLDNNINDYYDQELKYADYMKLVFIKMIFKIHVMIQTAKETQNMVYKPLLEDKDQIDLIFKINSFDIVINLAAQAGVRYSIKNMCILIQT